MARMEIETRALFMFHLGKAVQTALMSEYLEDVEWCLKQMEGQAVMNRAKVEAAAEFESEESDD